MTRFISNLTGGRKLWSHTSFPDDIWYMARLHRMPTVVACFTSTLLWLILLGDHAPQASCFEGLEVSAYLLNPASHVEFASQELWRCLVRALLPPGFVRCCTALEVTYWLICYLENHLLITSVITPVSSWPQQSGESFCASPNLIKHETPLAVYETPPSVKGGIAIVWHALSCLD